MGTDGEGEGGGATAVSVGAAPPVWGVPKLPEPSCAAEGCREAVPAGSGGKVI